jgi:hypothetical protein
MTEFADKSPHLSDAIANQAVGEYWLRYVSQWESGYCVSERVTVCVKESELVI